MSSVAIITARGGSKRIPRKNIKEFCGKPIICYSITAAIESGAFDEIMVSTDDKEIAEVAISAGAVVPFFRSGDTANDYATTDQVIAEVLLTYKENGKEFDRFCCIYPTAPFITPERLREAMDKLDQHESVTPVVQFSYPPQRGFVIENERLVRKYPEFASTRSQDLDKLYHDSGQFYACRTDAFFRDNTTDTDDMVPVILNESEVQDIDTFEDWMIAEQKYRALKSKGTDLTATVFDDDALQTPYYRIDEAKLLSDTKMLQSALEGSWNNYICSFSVKTNSLPWLLTFFKKQDFFAEVVSKEEYELSRRLGYPKDKIIYNGPIKDRKTFEEVLLSGGYVNMDSSYEPLWLKEIAEENPDKNLKVGLRVNYDIHTLIPDEVLADEEGSRFGYSYENGQLAEVVEQINKITNATIVGLHLHSSTKSRSVKAYEALASVAVKMAEEFNLDLEYVDMGGGYYGGVEGKPDFRQYVPAIAKVLSQKFIPDKTKLVMEPGVSMVSSSFDFVTSVIDTKHIRDHVYVVIDGSRVNLNPQVTRRWYPHRFEFKGSDNRQTLDNQMICGATCMEYDRLFAAENEKELKTGDRVVFTNAGGYTVCLTPLFIHYFPGVYVKKTDGSLFVARKPWTNDEYMQNNYYEP
ncbi:pseudaminic acid cytidylyltransferase [Butyrivibrio proteoclasticus]|uniref:pseudaminic acid cytidylyltransferase n=1 Tax=Butyrivibrio proteoclasticus TaxID=43305 RepID=UPI0009E015D6|nr:pseudaminic acid cytidylyltransferase [Butyrivibrio proteoclasticus]